MIYLCSPYTARDSAWPDSLESIRYAQNLHVLAILTSRGHLVLSPVVLGHTMDRAMQSSGLPRPGYTWWLAWSQELLFGCDSMWVLCIDDWRESRGVASEIAYARDHDIPIVYIDSEGNQILVEEEE